MIKCTTKKSNIEDILAAVHILENIYDVVRIVDPVQNQVIHLKTKVYLLRTEMSHVMVFGKENAFVKTVFL